MRSSRIEHEKRVVKLMIRLYCQHKEKNTRLCSSCEELVHYAQARLEHCPFGEEKDACQRCIVHCYKPAMREKMKEVMQFVGPRMIIYAPFEALKHLFRR